jgi:hypothetical protein
MNSAELFIGIQNINKKPPSELPAEVVECMVQCFRSGWRIEFIDRPQEGGAWMVASEIFERGLVEEMLRTQKVSCFRVVVW